MSVKVSDPGSRLPKESLSIISLGAKGTLVVPDRGIAIHPDSVRQLLTMTPLDRPAAFVPRIPVASDLGLPQYKPLLYWLPTLSTPQAILHGIRDYLAGKGCDPDKTVELDKKTQWITATSKDEQIYYFVDNLHAFCQKPAQVSVVISNVCNLKCIMCPYHSPQIRVTHRTPFFREKVWMSWKLLDQIASECGRLQIPVKMGNVEEPLLHHDIVKFVRACRSRGVPSVHVTTNGYALSQDMARDLLEAGLTSIYFSIDAASPSTYHRIRGGSLERVESNIRNFLKVRQARDVSCSVMVSFVLNEDISEEEVTDFRERWLEETDGIIFYNLAQYEKGKARFGSIHKVAKEMLSREGRRWPCLNPWQEIYLLPDGRAYYCCETISKLAFDDLETMGKYPQQDLIEIWNGKQFGALRRDLISNELNRWPACKDCGIWMAHVTETVARVASLQLGT